MKTKSLYIIRRNSGVCLFHKDFTASVYDPDLISSFMVAMTSFFDEATSSLDTESERKIQAALDNVIKGRTT